ncbi:cancer-related nucleoside-triphosphatase homolog [Hydractinia symbiolongicarpus]|uniref:cancer-related nucleoside-triphosphatase homolog n=1 Tax=Hydractinia symbiolongicarpus TaxID=13093 RepID=UPI00254EA1EA|nr:cancer-related nucleoside-triphosphatase homolog [Hydractinia symbiolongicarpus]
MAGSHSGCKILLTGAPGIGKTTVIKKVCEKLRTDNRITVCGFYTEEVRENGQRRGFDVVTLDGNRCVLARKSEATLKRKSFPSVGQYYVDIQSFESLALQSMKEEINSVIVIDEIGKMEVFSQKFSSAVRRIFNESKSPILATIPISKGKTLAVVEEISSRGDVQIITVSRDNRDKLVSEIAEQILAPI